MKLNFTFILEIALGTALASMIAPLFQQLWGKLLGGKQSWDETD